MAEYVYIEENLFKYWDDAFEITFTEEIEIELWCETQATATTYRCHHSGKLT